MLVCSIIAISRPVPPSKNVAHAIQHLAAGILLSAIALELIPPIAEAKGVANMVAIATGFSFGSIVMIALPFLLGEGHNRESGASAACQNPAADKVTDNPTTCITQGAAAITDPTADVPISPTGPRPALFVRREGSAFGAFDAQRRQQHGDRFPVVLAAAVYIDCVMDGLLVGISLLSGDRCNTLPIVPSSRR